MVSAQNMHSVPDARTRPPDAAKMAARCHDMPNDGEGTLNAMKLIVAAWTGSMANAALAAVAVPLGTPLGHPLGLRLGGTLGTTLGSLLGSPLGEILPVASVGLLTVSAASLAVGIYIVKRKKRR